MLKKFIVLILLLAAVVFGAGCITEADDAAGIYMLESTDITMNGEKSIKNIGDVNRFGDLTTPSDTVIELRDDGTLTYTTIHREAPTEGTWVPGEDTFDIPGDDEGETLTGVIKGDTILMTCENSLTGLKVETVLKMA